MFKKQYNLIIIFIFIFFSFNIFSNECLSPRHLNFSNKDYERIINDIGLKNTLIKKLLFEDSNNKLVLKALLNDPALVPVFLVIPPDSGEIEVINKILFESIAGKKVIDKYSAFVVGTPSMAEKMLERGYTKILIGVKDRASKNNVISDFETSNNRQTFFPLENGLWLGVGGSGVYNEKGIPFYINKGKKKSEPQKYQGIITGDKINSNELTEISKMKVKGKYFPQVIACRRINNIPDGNGRYINASLNGINSYLLFQLHLTPHRFNHFQQIVGNDPSLQNIINTFNSTWEKVDTNFKVVKNPKDYFRFVLKKWGKLRAELINMGYDKTTFHIQDLELFGNIADDIEEHKMGNRYGLELKLRFHILNILSIVHNIDVITSIAKILDDAENDISVYITDFFDAYFSKLKDEDIIEYWTENFSFDDPLYIWAKSLINELVIKDLEKNPYLRWPKNDFAEGNLFSIIFQIIEKNRGNFNESYNINSLNFLLKSA